MPGRRDPKTGRFLPVAKTRSGIEKAIRSGAYSKSYGERQLRALERTGKKTLSRDVRAAGRGHTEDISTHDLTPFSPLDPEKVKLQKEHFRGWSKKRLSANPLFSGTKDLFWNYRISTVEGEVIFRNIVTPNVTSSIVTNKETMQHLQSVAYDYLIQSLQGEHGSDPIKYSNIRLQGWFLKDR